MQDFIKQSYAGPREALRTRGGQYVPCDCKKMRRAVTAASAPQRYTEAREPFSIPSLMIRAINVGQSRSQAVSKETHKSAVKNMPLYRAIYFLNIFMVLLSPDFK
jgi:hypothetical protein